VVWSPFVLQTWYQHRISNQQCQITEGRLNTTVVDGVVGDLCRSVGVVCETKHLVASLALKDVCLSMLLASLEATGRMKVLCRWPDLPFSYRQTVVVWGYDPRTNAVRVEHYCKLLL